jgi:endonuclease/exonuclease/phosphatase family metal-dependent hydrolase
VALFVRSWNLFHGNAFPPRRRSYLREMIALACADDPDVLCVQEVPVWAVQRLAEWSGRRSFPAVARHGVRWPALAGRATRLHNGLLRSAITGQANAILVRCDLDVEDLGGTQVSGHGHERRVCHAVRLGSGILVTNTHLSSSGHRQQGALERVLEFAESLARAGEAVVVAGDLNLHDPVLPGFSAPGPGIDHVLVRDATATPLAVWPEERRVQNGVVLSDHPPVELRVG